MKRAAKLMIGVIALLIFLAAGHVFAENVKIGVDIPLTGDYAFIGNGGRDAILMGKDQMGKTKHNYELIFEDGKYDTKMDATVGNKFVSADKVDIIISIGGGAAGVLAPIADQNGVIHFAITSLPASTIGDLNFAHWTPVEMMTTGMVEQIKKRGFKRPAIVVNVDLTNIAPLYQDIITRMKFIETVEMHKGQTDFRTDITKLKQANPDIIVLFTMIPELDILIKQIKEMGLDARLTALEHFEMSKERTLIEGEFYLSAADPTKDFSGEFKRRYGRDYAIASPHAYDVIRMVITAAENVKGKPTAKSIAAELNKLKNFPGALGPLTVREDGRVLSNPAVKMIKNGQIVVLE